MRTALILPVRLDLECKVESVEGEVVRVTLGDQDITEAVFADPAAREMAEEAVDFMDEPEEVQPQVYHFGAWA